MAGKDFWTRLRETQKRLRESSSIITKKKEAIDFKPSIEGEADVNTLMKLAKEGIKGKGDGYTPSIADIRYLPYSIPETKQTYTGMGDVKEMERISEFEQTDPEEYKRREKIKRMLGGTATTEDILESAKSKSLPFIMSKKREDIEEKVKEGITRQTKETETQLAVFNNQQEALRKIQNIRDNLDKINKDNPNYFATDLSGMNQFTREKEKLSAVIEAIKNGSYSSPGFAENIGQSFLTTMIPNLGFLVGPLAGFTSSISTEYLPESKQVEEGYLIAKNYLKDDEHVNNILDFSVPIREKGAVENITSGIAGILGLLPSFKAAGNIFKILPQLEGKSLTGLEGTLKLRTTVQNVLKSLPRGALLFGTQSVITGKPGMESTVTGASFEAANEITGILYALVPPKYRSARYIAPLVRAALSGGAFASGSYVGGKVFGEDVNILEEFGKGVGMSLGNHVISSIAGKIQSIKDRKPGESSKNTFINRLFNNRQKAFDYYVNRYHNEGTTENEKSTIINILQNNFPDELKTQGLKVASGTVKKTPFRGLLPEHLTPEQKQDVADKIIERSSEGKPITENEIISILDELEIPIKREALIKEESHAVREGEKPGSIQQERERTDEGLQKEKEDRKLKAGKQIEGTETGVSDKLRDEEALSSGEVTNYDIHRQKGYKIVGGNKIERAKPISNKTGGNETDVGFSKKVTEKAKYVLIESEDLQPSHKSGNVNEKHFLPEAQPRNRGSLDVLKKEAAIKANKLDPQQLINTSPNAFFGTPIVNSRGEIIQGNGRGEAIDYYYRVNSKDTRGYKNYLIEHASEFGLDSKTVTTFKNPVLVRMVDVDDTKAIELGNYKSSDLEDISQQGRQVGKAEVNRIPVQYARDISDMIARSSTEENSLKDIIRSLSNKLVKKLQDSGAIGEDETELYLDENNNMTAQGMDNVHTLIRGLLFKGGDVNLPETFERLPHKIKQGLEKSITEIVGVDTDKSIVNDVQSALVGLNELQVARKKNKKLTVDDWLEQEDMMRQSASERYTPLEQELIRTLDGADKQSDITAVFRNYKDLVTDKPANLFDAAVKGLSKEEGIKKSFGKEKEDVSTGKETERQKDKTGRTDFTRPEAEKETGRKRKAKDTSTGKEKSKSKLDQEIEDLESRLLKSLGGSLKVGIDPESLSLSIQLVSKYIEKGAYKLESILREIYNKYGKEAYRKYFNAIKAGYNGYKTSAEDDIADKMDDYDYVRGYKLETIEKEMGIFEKYEGKDIKIGGTYQNIFDDAEIAEVKEIKNGKVYFVDGGWTNVIGFADSWEFKTKEQLESEKQHEPDIKAIESETEIIESQVEAAETDKQKEEVIDKIDDVNERIEELEDKIPETKIKTKGNYPVAVNPEGYEHTIKFWACDISRTGKNTLGGSGWEWYGFKRYKDGVWDGYVHGFEDEFGTFSEDELKESGITHWVTDAKELAELAPPVGWKWKEVIKPEAAEDEKIKTETEQFEKIGKIKRDAIREELDKTIEEAESPNRDYILKKVTDKTGFRPDLAIYEEVYKEWKDEMTKLQQATAETYEPRPDWENHLIKAREYAAVLKIPFKGDSLETIVGKIKEVVGIKGVFEPTKPVNERTRSDKLSELESLGYDIDKELITDKQVDELILKSDPERLAPQPVKWVMREANLLSTSEYSKEKNKGIVAYKSELFLFKGNLSYNQYNAIKDWVNRQPNRKLTSSKTSNIRHLPDRGIVLTTKEHGYFTEFQYVKYSPLKEIVGVPKYQDYLKLPENENLNENEIALNYIKYLEAIYKKGKLSKQDYNDLIATLPIKPKEDFKLSDLTKDRGALIPKPGEKSDLLPSDEIRTNLLNKPVKLEDDESAELPAGDDLRESEYLTSVEQIKNNVFYRELFNEECFTALKEKPGYEKLSKKEALAKLVKDRMIKVGEDTGLVYQSNTIITNADDDTLKPGEMILDIFYVKKEVKENIAHYSLALDIAQKLNDGEKIKDNTELTKLADEKFKGTIAAGKYTIQQAYDALETAVNEHISENPELYPLDDTDTALENLRDLLSRIPTQRGRTLEKDTFQQFSTPPTIAYIMDWVANANKNDIALEPSAGNGGLIAFLKDKVKDIHTNEIDDNRRTMLNNQGYKTTKVDAMFLNDVLDKKIKPTLIIMNPPFSATGGVSKNKTENGLKHIEQALTRLEPNGRAVILFGEGIAFDKITKREWWEKMMKKYNVRANIGLSGDEYMKYGTTFDNQLIVIDKTGPTPGVTFSEKITYIKWGKAESLEDAIDKLTNIKNDRAAIEGNLGEADGDLFGEPGKSGESATGGKTGLLPSTERPEGGTGLRGSGGDELQTEESTRKDTERESGTESGRQATGDRSDIEPGERGTRSKNNELKLETTEKPVKREQESGGKYVEYKPQKLNTGVKHPTKLVEAASMSAIEPPDVTYTPHISQKLIDKGKPSSAQLESIVYAGQSHQLFLPDGNRRGFFVGDGTGVGKGVIGAGIILDNFNQGRKKAVWFIPSQDLMKDGIRDIDDLGFNTTVSRINDFNINDKIPLNEGIIFSTYATFRMDSKTDRTKSRLQQIVDWVGPEFEGALILDESHKAKNAVEGQDAGTLTGQKVLEIQALLPRARIVYMSATGATEVSNMAYLQRLGLWGPGTPFASFSDFETQIMSGGLGAMEIVSRDMKAMGLYNSRNISFEGIEYEEVKHKITPDQKHIYDTSAVLWQAVLENINEALDITNGVKTPSQRNAMVRFWNDHQRFFNNIITAIKVPTLIEETEKLLTQDKSIIISLINTGEARTAQKTAEAIAKGEDLEDLDFSPREIIYHYVDAAFPTQLYRSEIDESTGRPVKVPVRDEAGNLVQSSEALEMKQRLLDTISDINLPENPLDQIINHFKASSVAEITGRKRRLLINERTGKKEYMARSSKGVPLSRVNINETELFQGGKKRIAIISQAGSTGISLHSDLRAKNQQQRMMITLQLSWSADSQLQAVPGRGHRSNQKIPPGIKILHTDIGGEVRFSSSMAKRLGSMGAITKGQRDTSGGDTLAKYNFDSDYGKAALRMMYENIMANRAIIPGISNPRDVLRKMGVLKQTSDGEVVPDTNKLNIGRYLNRILSLEVDTQNAMFSYYESVFTDLVQAAKDSGTFDEGVSTVKGENIKLNSSTVINTNEETGAKTKHFEVSIDVKTEPVTWEDASEIYNRMEALRTEHGSSKVSFFGVNKRSKKVFLIMEVEPVTDTRTGSITRRVKKFHVSGNVEYLKHRDITGLASGNYDEIKPKEAQDLWKEELKEIPATRNEKMHIIGGALLPIWNRVQIVDEEGRGQFKIVRVTTDDGESIIGLKIPEQRVGEILSRLQISSAIQSPEDIFNSVLRNGVAVDLENNMQLKRSKLHGEDIIELTNVPSALFNKLRGMGLFSERIDFKQKFFIPADETTGIDVVSKLINEYTVVSQFGKPETDVRFQKDDDLPDIPVEPFYSQLERVAEAKVSNNALPEQILKTLRNSGVKEEEIKWLGLEEWLKDKGKVSKAELMQFIANNKLEIEEKMLQSPYGKKQYAVYHTLSGDTVERFDTRNEAQTYLDELMMERDDKVISKDAAIEMLKNNMPVWIYDGEETWGLDGAEGYDMASEADSKSLFYKEEPENYAIDDTFENESDLLAPKYAGSETNLPGGENYREWLIKLPVKNDRYEVRDFGLSWRVWDKENKEWVSKRASTATEAENLMIELVNKNVFKGNHYNEPNLMMHIRVDDRILSDKRKMLFVQEFQDDWAKKGQKFGYQPTKVPDNLIFERNGKWRIRGAYDPSLKWNTKKEAESFWLSSFASRGAVPDRPYKKTWHEFAMKKIIRKAAEEGYDVIAWTTGEQQNDRYNLSKYVSQIRFYSANKGKSFELTVLDKNEDDISQELKLPVDIPAGELEKYIGKDVAERIIKNPDHEGILTGDDLKVGGRGMIVFYDEILVNFANKIGKKWGAKVETSELQGSKTVGQRINEITNEFESNGYHIEIIERADHDFDIVDKDDENMDWDQLPKNLRKLAQEFYDLLPQEDSNVYRDYINISESEAKRRWNNGESIYGIDEDGDYREVTTDEELASLKLNLYGDYYKQGKAKSNFYTVHSLPITPEMKADVLQKGQPMFQKEGVETVSNKFVYLNQLRAEENRLKNLLQQTVFELGPNTPYSKLQKRLGEVITEIKTTEDAISKLKPEDLDSDQLAMFDKFKIGKAVTAAHLDTFVSTVSKAFPNVKVRILDDSGIKEHMIKLGYMQKEADTTPRGFFEPKTGIVYINKDKANLATPIHEFGHIFNMWLKLTKPGLWKEGLRLVSENKSLMKYIGFRYPELLKEGEQIYGYSERLLDEALAASIGVDGADAMWTEMQGKDKKNLYERFQAWLKKVWERIKEGFTGKKLNVEKLDLRKATLNDFSQAVGKDLIRGKAISNLTGKDIFEWSKAADELGIPIMPMEKAAPILPQVYFNSHGISMSFKKFINIEIHERKNYKLNEVKQWMKKYNINNSDKVIWVTPDKWMANSYNRFSSDVDIYKTPEEELDIVEINGKEGFIIPESDDGDNGYLFVYRNNVKVNDTPAFKKWFGKSKVVDKKGNPLRLYHGTREDFNVFNVPAWFSITPKDANWYAQERHVVHKDEWDTESMGKFSKAAQIKGANLMSVYARIENPVNLTHYKSGKVLDATDKITFEQLKNLLPFELSEDTEFELAGWTLEAYPLWQWIKNKNLLKDLENNNYDGIKAIEGGDINYMVLNRNQIKSATGNRGTFSNLSPDIRFDKADFSQSLDELAQKVRDEDFEDFREELKQIARKFNLDIEKVLSNYKNAPDILNRNMSKAYLRKHIFKKELVPDIRFDKDESASYIKDEDFNKFRDKLSKAGAKIIIDSGGKMNENEWIDYFNKMVSNSTKKKFQLTDKQGHELFKESQQLITGKVKEAEKVERNAPERKVPLEAELFTEPKKEEAAKPKTGKIFDRRFSEQVKASEDVSPKIKKGLKNTEYRRITNPETLAEANEFLDNNDIESAVRKLASIDYLMSDRVRITSSEILIKRLSDEADRLFQGGNEDLAEEKYEQAIDVADRIAAKLTVLGQGVQAAAMFSRLSPEGVLRYAQRQIQRGNNKKLGNLRERIKSISDIIEKANKDEIDNVMKDLKELLTKLAEKIKPERVQRLVKQAEELAAKKLAAQSVKEMRQRKRVDQGAANQLAKRISNTLNTVESKFNPVKQMVSTLFDVARENGLVPEKQPKTKETILKAIKSAIENSEKYSKVWEDAKKIVEDRFSDDPEALEMLNKYFEYFLEEPFSQKQITRVTKDTLKQMEANITEIVKQHYSVADKTKGTLVQRLINEAGMEESDAKVLAKAVSKKFEQMTSDKKQQLLTARLKPKVFFGKKDVQFYKKIVELSNLGALSTEVYRDLFAVKYKLDKIEPEEARKLIDLANKVQEAPEGFKRHEKVVDLLTYMRTMKGIKTKEVIMSWFYASILSGITTSAKNILYNTYNMALELALRNPAELPNTLMGLYIGLGKGFNEAGQIIIRGYGEHGKFQDTSSVNPIDQYIFKGGNWNPLNYMKHISRSLQAQDRVFYWGLNEAEARAVAYTLAKEKGLKGKALLSEVQNIVNESDEKVQQARVQAEAEGFKGREQKRRIAEILHQSRSEELNEQTDRFAARGTLNYTPRGLVGYMVRAIQGFQRNPGAFWSKFIVPFTNIVGNVLNNNVDFTPWGYKRAFFGYTGESQMEGREYTKEILRASFGSLALVTLGLLADIFSDKDDGYSFTVTAQGTMNTARNNQLRETGWRPYSFRIKGKWFSYLNTPLAIPFAFIGYTKDQFVYKKQLDNKDFWDRLTAASVLTLISVVDQSFLSGLAQFFTLFDKSNPEKPENYFKSFVTGTISSFMVPNIIKQLGRVYDNTLYETGNTLTGMIIRNNGIAQDILGLKPRLNILGEPIKRDGLLQSVGMPSGSKQDRIWDLIIKNKSYITVPNKNTMIFDGVNDRTMTPEEYYRYIEISGPLIRKGIDNNYDFLSSLNPDEVRDMINSITHTSREIAKYQITGLKVSDDEELLDHRKVVKTIKRNVDRAIDTDNSQELERGRTILDKLIKSENVTKEAREEAQELYGSYDRYVNLRTKLSGVNDIFDKHNIVKSDGKIYRYVPSKNEKENFTVDYDRAIKLIENRIETVDDNEKLSKSERSSQKNALKEAKKEVEALKKSNRKTS